MATEEMSGETVMVVVKLEDVINTSTRSFQIDVAAIVVEEGVEEVDNTEELLAEAVEAIDDIMDDLLGTTEIAGSGIVSDGEDSSSTTNFEGVVVEEEETTGDQP